MGRESSDRREERLKRAGDWLRSERLRRGLTQEQLGRQLNINQVQVSTYERGSYEVEAGIARDIAAVFGLDQMDVWTGLEIPLPDTVTDEAKLIDWVARRLSGRQMVALAQKAAPELMTRSPRAKPKDPGNRPQKVTRTSERSRHEAQGEQSAV